MVGIYTNLYENLHHLSRIYYIRVSHNQVSFTKIKWWNLQQSVCESSTIEQNEIYMIIVDSSKLAKILPKLKLKLETESEQESLHYMPGESGIYMSQS